VGQSLAARIGKVDSKLNAFFKLDAEGALDAARAAEKEIARGEARGALHGVPVGVKDIIDVAGQATTCHSKVRLDHVAREDADGFWHIVDRTKDMIVSGGFNVFPREVEDVVAEHPAVAQVAVIGTPDEKFGEAVTAIVVPRPGHELTADVIAEIQAAVKERKGSVQVPKKVIAAEAIPMTALGKPDKKALRAQYA
jgi:acyl-CoA synthetase (AMP-forming)/AMP-acid ligase II